MMKNKQYLLKLIKMR